MSTGIPKYISSPQVLAGAVMGSTCQTAFAVSVSFNRAANWTGPAVTWMFFAIFFLIR